MTHRILEVAPTNGPLAKRNYVLNFHGVGQPGRNMEPGEEDYWLSIEAFEQYLDLIADVNANGLAHVHITFDDGNLSDYEIALPRLMDRGLEAQFFVLTGRLKCPHSLSALNLHTLKSSGMKIGIHGVDHLDWKLTPNRLIERDVKDCKSLLEDILGAPIDDAAVPYNSYDRRVLRTLRTIGLRRLYTSDGGNFQANAWLTPRTCIRADMSLEDIELMLTLGHKYMRSMRHKMNMLRKIYGVPDWTKNMIFSSLGR